MEHFLVIYHGIYPSCHLLIPDIHSQQIRACVYIGKHSDVGLISHGIPFESIAYREDNTWGCVDMEYIFQRLTYKKI